MDRVPILEVRFRKDVGRPFTGLWFRAWGCRSLKMGLPIYSMRLYCLCMHVRLYVCLYVCMQASMYVCMYVCLSVYEHASMSVTSSFFAASNQVLLVQGSVL